MSQVSMKVLKNRGTTAKQATAAAMQAHVKRLEALLNRIETENDDSIEEEYLKTGELKMEETKVKREKVRIKDLSLRRLAKLKTNELSALVIDELELIGVRMPPKPQKPRRPGSDEKYNTAINAIRKLSKELDKPDSSSYGWRYNNNSRSSEPTPAKIASYKKKVGKLIEELVTDKIKVDADYKKRMEILAPKLTEHERLSGIYKGEMKDYKEAKAIYDKTKAGLVRRIDVSKTQVKFIEKCAKKYLDYLDVANSDRDMAFKFLLHAYPKAEKIDNFRAQVLEYVLDTAK